MGRIDSSGDVKWRGSVFSRGSSGSKLSFLNNMIRVFEAEIDMGPFRRKYGNGNNGRESLRETFGSQDQDLI
jgi:hypothetical protein